ncbi:hypothetical protein Pedsa_0709 [Pseudopedobacter saltans DSM 12145]|uniref:Right handed beta helix domain-containing protein n=2 Tax=Pseudopedobacter saltans TaxID=151895 RepID=F0S8K1_PSESL|nr:hypothetical protein Pedsa_0709 [Pseudopedobacter saltans DSM 12145]
MKTKMKIINILLLMFIVSLTKASPMFNIKQLYVSYEQKGTGTGDSESNAADFLNSSFWKEVNTQLKKQPITVLFLEGNYSRTFTQKPLKIEDIGSPNNLLIIKGIPEKTWFTADPNEFSGERSVLVDIVNSQNIQISNFSFKGNGKLGYALRITSTNGGETKNILVNNCLWTDMRGIIYGTTGVHQKGTKNVTYKNCTFKRVGIDSHSHHIYNAYNPSYIYIIDSHFEDCTGDYVRFRDSTDYCIVKGSKFVRNKDFPSYPFISMPNFNKARAESFASNYAFYDNDFINNGDNSIVNAIVLHHYGYNRPGFNYLLTKEEGDVLTNGTAAEKKKLLAENFGIDTDQIRVYNNRYSNNIQNKVAIGSFPAYGAESKGWKGFGDIYSTVKNTNVPFKWEANNLNE